VIYDVKYLHPDQKPRLLFKKSSHVFLITSFVYYYEGVSDDFTPFWSKHAYTEICLLCATRYCFVILDNHESHCSLHAVFARQNGIVMDTFPPHCAHRQQPLDVAIMGTFKAKYTVTENEWMMPVLEKKEAVAYSTQWPELLEVLEVI